MRVPAIAASGVANLAVRSFAPGLVAGNTLFVGAHFLLGFAVGLPAVAFVQAAGPTLEIGAFVGLAVLGAVAWVFIRRRRRTTLPAAESAYGDWTDAACPACIGIAFVRD